MAPQHQHLIVLTGGHEDEGRRATLAFALGVSLQVMGSEVAFFLDSRAAVFACQQGTRGIAVRGFDPLESYVRMFEEGGGQVFVHTGGLQQLPGWSEERQWHSEFGSLRPGVTLAGAATLAALILERKHVAF